MAAAVLNTRELADQLDTDPKTLRRFFRSPESPVDRVGQGNRYIIERRQLAKLRREFTAWKSSHTRQANAA